MRNNLMSSATGAELESNRSSTINNITAHRLLNSISRGVISVTKDGILTYINRYAAELLQVDDSILGKRVDMLQLRTPIYKLLSEQCNESPLEITVNGRTILAQSSQLVSDDQLIDGELIEIRDITDDKRARKEWEEFIAMMTHDLRSPLSVIMGYIHGMKCGLFGDLNNQITPVIKKFEENGRKLNAMIDEMLDNFRLQFGSPSLVKQQCNIISLLEKCKLDNLQEAEDKKIKLELIYKSNLTNLNIDPKQMTRVFNNLINNAIKYTPSPGYTRIFAEECNDSIIIKVHDSGMGIKEEELSRIFYKYYRSAQASELKGTGLGLSICKTIVEAHGGNIIVESKLGLGSIFTVSIPISDQLESEQQHFTNNNYTQAVISHLTET